MNIKCLAFAALAGIGLIALAAHTSPDLLVGYHAIAGGGLFTAGMIGVPLNARARGLMATRAEGAPADIKATLDEMARTFEAFKAEHTKELADLKKKQGDVVQSEKVDRINDEIGKLQAALDQTNAMLAAVKIGGAGDDPQDPAKAEYAKAFNRFFRRGVDAGLNDLAVKAAMSTDSDPDGGYVVPDQMESTIDRILGTVSAMRNLSRVVSISTGIYKKLVNQGGAAGGWVGEKEARPQTDASTLSALEFPAMELYAMPAATQSLLDDASLDIGAWLGDEVSITFAEMEGAAFISGSGVNQPRGLLSYTKVANANYAWGKLGFIATGVAADINDSTHNGADALIDLVYSIKQGYRQNASFLMNRTLQSKVRKLKTIGDTEDYLWQPSVQVGQPATLLGYPVSDEDNMPDVGAGNYPIAFGDFRRGYLVVDRTGVRVLRDPFTAKPYVLFYTTKRVGGGVQNFEAIKLLKCA